MLKNDITGPPLSKKEKHISLSTKTNVKSGNGMSLLQEGFYEGDILLRSKNDLQTLSKVSKNAIKFIVF